MTMDTSEWLKHIETESKKLPLWLQQVLDHPQFAALHREAEGWLIYTNEDQHIAAPELREACEKFRDHYGL